uniref:Uncharacterized protein n=1 Tax=Globodera pallida TaxID=36090 RepID=A0A183BWM9_GLOPA
MKLFTMLMLRFEIEVINEISTAQVPISLDDLSGIRQIKKTFDNMSIAKEFEKEFNTFIFEVELELTKQNKWALGINNELGNKFNALWTSTEQKEFKWKDIKKNIGELENLDEKNIYRKKLDDLAKNALNETVPLKAIITQKLDKVVVEKDREEIFQAYQVDKFTAEDWQRND